MSPAAPDSPAAPAAPLATPLAAPRTAGPLRRVAAIGRAEVTLFVRNPTILATALLLAPAMVVIMGPMLGRDLIGPAFATFLTEMLATWSLLLVVL